LKKHHKFDKEYIIINHKNRKELWVHGLGQLETDNNDRPLRLIGTIMDITERKKAEEAMRESEERYRMFFENSADGIFISESKGKIISANPEACRIFGRSEKELCSLVGRNELFDMNDSKFQAGIMERKISSKTKIEANGFRKDGTVFPCEISSSIFQTSSGAYRSSNIIRDISDRKQSDYLLKQTRQNYEGFFNTIDEFLFVLDDKGNIIHTNNTVTDRLGYTSEELQGESVLMVHPPERREEAGRIVGEMLNGLTEYCPVPVMTKSGIQIPVETRVSYGNWDGRPAIFGVTKDISKIKLSEEKFSKLFYLNPFPCGLSDLADHTYVEVNEVFYSLFGFDKDEVIGRTASELGIATSETLNAVSQKADSNGKVINAEAELKTKNGDIKHVLMSAENIYIQDKKYRFTVVHDITEQKKAEAEIKLKNEELIRLNAEKDKFFSIIAHDLRSPFNAFLGLTQIMVEELSTLTLAEIQEIAESMRKSATHLYSLLENLLEWSRLQRGVTTYYPESLSVKSAISESMGFVLESATAKEIGISYNIPEDLVAFADKNMFGCVIRNLSSNAIKFNPKGGKVSISAKQISGNLIEISIQDTGIGIKPEMMGNLFRPDINTSRKGTDGEPSTGLGLIVCKEFIEKHGGTLWLESEVSKGTSFYFTLPNSKFEVN